MVTIPYSKKMPQLTMIAHFVTGIGGCLQTKDDNSNAQLATPEQIHGGDLDGMYGFSGHNPEKHVSWSIAIGGDCLYVEMFPSSCETMALLELSH